MAETKKESYKGSTVAIVLGILTAISSGSSPTYSDNAITGIAMILGGLFYMARKKQGFRKSTKWKVTEILTGVLLALQTLLGILNGMWYVHPIPFVVIPLWTLIAYLVLLKKQKK